MSNLLSLPMLVMRSLACLEADGEGSNSNASIACLTSIAAFDKAPLNDTGRGDNITALPPHSEASEYKYWALALCIVPLLTICGNSLVILAVVRVRALHSAINYFIMGLAAADLCVGLTVMPHAVYTELRAGKWLLGQIWCDFYCTTDVACSTASIFTLTVISFDRYRAVKFPIQYSKETRNVRRVAFIIAGVWLISFATASPMFLGINRPPEGELAHEECRFYNADYILYSSLVSFGIPLMIVLFVYARIMIAIRERERLSRERKANVAAMAERRKSRSVAVTQATNDPERPMLTNSASAQEQSATVSELGAKASESSPPPTKPNAILSPGSDGPRSNGGVVPGKDGIPLISFPSTDGPEPEPVSIQQEEETEPMDIQLNTSSANASLHFSLASRTDTKASVEYSPSCVEEMSFIDESLSPASRSSAAAFSALSGSPKDPNLGMGVPTANQPRSATHPCLSKEGDCLRLGLRPSVTAPVSYIFLNFVSADDASSLGGGSLPTDSERSHFGDYFLSPPPSPDSAPLLSAVSPTPPSLRFPLSLAAQETLDEDSEAALVHLPTSPPKKEVVTTPSKTELMTSPKTELATTPSETELITYPSKTKVMTSQSMTEFVTSQPKTDVTAVSEPMETASIDTPDEAQVSFALDNSSVKFDLGIDNPAMQTDNSAEPELEHQSAPEVTADKATDEAITSPVDDVPLSNPTAEEKSEEAANIERHVSWIGGDSANKNPPNERNTSPPEERRESPAGAESAPLINEPAPTTSKPLGRTKTKRRRPPDAPRPSVKQNMLERLRMIRARVPTAPSSADFSRALTALGFCFLTFCL